MKYTHDSEAAFAHLRPARELRHVEDDALMSFIVQREDYCAADYYTDDEAVDFISTKTWIYGDKSNLRIVTLHDLDTLSKNVLDHFGFSCIVCGCFYQKELPRGRYYGEIDSAIRSRQTICSGILSCKECNSFLFALAYSPTSLSRELEGVISRIINDVEAFA